jgi:hypothetical protein
MTKWVRAALVLVVCLASLTFAMSEEPPGDSGKKSEVIERPSLAEARRQAETLHTAMHATLQIVHHQFYRLDEGLPIPAATFEDVFAALEEEHHVKLRWLTVEGQAMNSDHKPRDTFEHDAVKALKSGKPAFERAENGVYRRAGSITLLNDCLKCHIPNRTSTKNRTAGLIISIPIKKK